MGFWDHIAELRGTLIKSVVAIGVGIGVAALRLNDLKTILLWPLHAVQMEDPSVEVDLATRSVTEIFHVILQICAVGGIILAAPFILFFVGQFVAPALTERERRTVLPLLASGLVLFLGGCAFSFFYLMPATIRVAAWWNTFLGTVMIWTPQSYFGTVAWFVLGVGVAFQFPLVIVLLIHLEMLATATLRKYRRHAVVVIFIVSAIVTPTADPLVQSLFALPLYILFELSIQVGRRIERRRQKAS